MVFNSIMPDMNNGDGEVDTSKRKAPNVDFPIERYAPFGDLAETFMKQGWKPELWNNEFTDYRPVYGMLNSVELGNGKKGYISVRGGNTNGVFSLMIKDDKGNVVGQPILQNVGAKDILDYFTNAGGKKYSPGSSVIAQRVNQIQQQQQPQPGGTMTSIY